jgi:hypothetical protein
MSCCCATVLPSCRPFVLSDCFYFAARAGGRHWVLWYNSVRLLKSDQEVSLSPHPSEPSPPPSPPSLPPLPFLPPSLVIYPQLHLPPHLTRLTHARAPTHSQVSRDIAREIKRCLVQEKALERKGGEGGWGGTERQRDAHATTTTETRGALATSPCCPHPRANAAAAQEKEPSDVTDDLSLVDFAWSVLDCLVCLHAGRHVCV